jgi:nucleoid-associated protein YgaU
MAPPALAKATLLNTVTREQITVMYNPEEYKLDHGNNFAEVGIPGLEAPPIQYVRGKARALTTEFFFDTFEEASDVRTYTSKLIKLLDKTPKTHAPPVLLFTFGGFTFTCVLVDVSQRCTMFLRDGTPVRATLSVRFQEYANGQTPGERGLLAAPPTMHTVAAGQTLSELAGSLLGDPARWREIADENGIDDPFNLQSGASLLIPGPST